MNQFVRAAYDRLVAPAVHYLFERELISHTKNFDSCRWMGGHIWQNVFDLWTIQETIAEIRPRLLIETGTNQGGSSMFYAHLFDLMGAGEVVTIDIDRLHALSHPRITYLLGSSTAPEIVAQVRAKAEQCDGPVMVILDSDHSQSHVAAELTALTPLVTPGSYCLVQDGIVDTQPGFRSMRPGPLPAIEEFVRTHASTFEIDEARCRRFLITHHPKGWLRRKPG